MDKAVFFSTMEQTLCKVYGQPPEAMVKPELEFCPAVIREDNLEENREFLKDVKYGFSTWGMTVLTEEQIRDYFPKLECVFYAAGSVQYFGRPFLNCGIRVFSAWKANGIPVAEFTLAQILLANKGYFQSLKKVKDHPGCFDEAARYCDTFGGNYGKRVGIIGVGVIGRYLIGLLKNFCLEVVVFDPFLSDEDAASLGVKKCSLEEIFSTCSVISNHLANNEQTKGMLCGRLFDLMADNATFINTGRGAQVVEADLIRALKEHPNRTALLDVTDPEPSLPDSPFYTMDNVFITPHRAGSVEDEVRRMAEFMVEDYRRVLRGEPSPNEVTLEMLKTMA